MTGQRLGKKQLASTIQFWKNKKYMFLRVRKVI